ncbi:MAG: acyl carrier protein [Deltaproteobacteria bacterium]|nr:acyl carrier protein [Deltaproteobacteria bacterium]
MIDEDAVYARVVEEFCEALGLDDDEIEPDSQVIEDLGAESLDFLDIAFRLERAFGVKVPRGEIQRSAEATAGEEFEIEGKLTAAGAVALREAMPEVDGSAIDEGFPVREIPRLFTVKTFHNMVLKLLAEKEASA